MQAFLLCVLLTFNCLLAVYPLRRIALVNPVVGFIIFNWVMGIGTIPVLDPTTDADLTHLIIILTWPLLISVGACFFSLCVPMHASAARFWSSPFFLDSRPIYRRALMLYAFSAVVTIIYYQLSGYNLLSLSLAGGGGDDFTSMRLASYSGDQYLAPGYVSQFKNTLLPALTFYIAATLMVRKSPYSLYFAIGGGMFLLYAVLGTGQRTFLVLSFLLLIYYSLALNKGDIPWKRLGIAVVFVILLFGFFSVQLGRMDNFDISSVFDQLSHRIFGSNQEASVVGFRYIYRKEIGIGEEWAQTVVGLLPGQKGSTIANEIHAILFGSDRGTAPLSVWGSIYYNVGFVGYLIITPLLGYVYAAIYYLFVRGSANLLRISGYVTLFLYLSAWVAGGPVQLLNNGILAAILLILVAKAYRWRRYS